MNAFRGVIFITGEALNTQLQCIVYTDDATVYEAGLWQASH